MTKVRCRDNKDISRPASQPAAVVRLGEHAYDIDSAADFRSIVHQPASAAASTFGGVLPQVSKRSGSPELGAKAATGAADCSFRTGTHLQIQVEEG